ncbi:hypothetical protein KPH14_009125 [Odynerus spinipes]|uniref:Uncharacterized protein n=1 Tax=Odynerus spinipes TaxID=1348599 RepID=A0AAD9VQC3_9HYME|nr:hypothetical protein KPH14_009125 [Odynerus spinipes]
MSHVFNIAEACARYPPTVASRCSGKLPCKEPPPCLIFPSCSPCPPTSTVQFVLKSDGNRCCYERCYRPVIPNCFPCPKPIRNVPCCCLKWYDCCGNLAATTPV